MPERVYNVLFLCTANSARSVLAESILNKVGKGKFRGFSAGSHPKGEVHPSALDLLRHLDFQTEGLRSKSWDERRPGCRLSVISSNKAGRNLAKYRKDQRIH
jgi:arsenate reductase